MDSIDLRSQIHNWIHLRTTREDKEVKLALTVEDREGNLTVMIWREGEIIGRVSLPIR